MRILACAVVVCVLHTVYSDSCAGRCGSAVDTSANCQCNEACVSYNDCCSDYHSVCLSEDSEASCVGRCGANLDHSKPCQCNSHCSHHGDCCSDYHSVCAAGSGATSDITVIANLLWQNDVNRVSSHYYSLDHQGRTTTSGKSDLAPNPLFRLVNEAHLLTLPTYNAFIHLLDNYDYHTGNTEHLTSAQQHEINHFLDTILRTQVMTLTEEFLRYNGKLSGSSGAFRELLDHLWFDLYRRTSGGPISSSGFEHVFVGETKSSKVSGFHSWVQFYREEQANRLDYKGYVSTAEPSLISAQFSWHGGTWKALGSFFVGTSPEFDMAIYTICFMMKPNSACRFDINNHGVAIQTYDNTHWAGQQIASAHPL